ncbi:hypothetical protein VNO77_13474 [Canavalia gladiata]|uniref:Amidase domain-containing protein n=1 Tax=Canavalia gladiata TaxID=3824 RepID=A0AAN9LYJ5_CANGL
MLPEPKRNPSLHCLLLIICVFEDITKFTIQGNKSPDAPLRSLIFAVKDMFDFEGYVATFGNPDWKRTHKEATSIAPSVFDLLEAGATFIGTTVMDELAYSIRGENIHYGTPRNPCVGDRVPGGSSSGSAVVAGADHVDFSIGTDCLGSSRIPASYCGVFGIRPSYGSISDKGVIHMAKSFDTVGWFATDPTILNKVGRVLIKLPRAVQPVRPTKVIVALDSFLLSSIPYHVLTRKVTKAIKKLYGENIIKYDIIGNYVMSKVPELIHFMDEEHIEPLAALSNAMQYLERCEFKNTHGEWIHQVRPILGPGVKQNVQKALDTVEDQKKIDTCHTIRRKLREAITDLLGDFGAIMMPTVPGPPPKLHANVSEFKDFSEMTFTLMSLSGVSGCCQVWQQALYWMEIQAHCQKLFDFEGYVATFGNPDWKRTHKEATSIAPSVFDLLEAGATFIGTTVMDELAYSIRGENIHYGTPRNPCVGDRVPGGSSSGSAVVAGADHVDFSIGTDCLGSSRIPASYCGVFGIRPSYGAISDKGVIHMAKSFDTVGWFATDPTILNKVGRVLIKLPRAVQPVRPTKVIVALDSFLLSSIPYHVLTRKVTKAIKKLYGENIIKYDIIGNYVMSKVPELIHFMDEEHIEPLAALSNAMQYLERCEFKNTHGEWIHQVRPILGPGVKQNVQKALDTVEDQKKIDTCHTIRRKLREAITDLLGDFGAIMMPTVPGPPPKLHANVSEFKDFSEMTFTLMSLSGVSGCCQVSMPLGMYHNLPISISLLAKHGADDFLLSMIEDIYPNIKEKEAPYVRV